MPSDTQQVCYAKSPVTGNWYRVTDWKEAGDGKIIAQQKEEIEKAEVPEEWVRATEEKLDGVMGDD